MFISHTTVLPEPETTLQPSVTYPGQARAHWHDGSVVTILIGMMVIAGQKVPEDARGMRMKQTQLNIPKSRQQAGEAPIPAPALAFLFLGLYAVGSGSYTACL